MGLAFVACAACRAEPEPEPERRPYAPPSAGPAQTIQIRNSCPEAVVVAISAEPPGATTPTITLGSTKSETLSVAGGARVWLRYDNRWDPELSVVPRRAIEVGFQCNAIYEGDRGL